MGLLGSIFGGGKTETTADVEKRLKEEAEGKGQEVVAQVGAGGEFRVDNVYRITGLGFVPVGQVVSGTIRPGYICNHMGSTYEIKTIEKNHQTLKEAVQGDSVGMNLKGVKDQSEIPALTVLKFVRKA